MGWVYLLISIVFEIGWASSLKLTAGYSRLAPSIANALLAAGGVITLSQATKTIPIAIAYPVWTGVSLIGVVVFGACAFDETIGIWQLAFIGLIAVGAIGLKML
jgi:quaternary ammonium compound-resistance protein SugE